MVRLHADTTHAQEGIERLYDIAKNEQKNVRLAVYDCEAVMRGIDLDEVRDRNLEEYIGDPVCELKYDDLRLNVILHQSTLEEPFTLDPAPHDAVTVDQADSPESVAPAVDPVIDALRRKFNVISFDFVEVSAGSIANGGFFTDFEFTWVATGFRDA